MFKFEKCSDFEKKIDLKSMILNILQIQKIFRFKKVLKKKITEKKMEKRKKRRRKKKKKNLFAKWAGPLAEAGDARKMLRQRATYRNRACDRSGPQLS